MFLEFSVENYRSIAERQVLSFVAGKHRSDADGMPAVDHPGFSAGKVLTSAVIYGANASGKSNLLRALNLATAYVAISAAPIRASVEPFRLDATWANKPTRVEMSFLKDGIRYQYGFALDKERVHEEWFIAYPKKVAQVWFTRHIGEDGVDIKFGPHLKGEKSRLATMTRSDALFLSTAAQFNHPQLSEIHQWLIHNVTAQRSHGFGPLRTIQLLENGSKEGASTVNELMRGADLGIMGLKVHRHTKMPDVASGTKMVVRTNKEDEIWEVLTEHRCLDGSSVMFDLLDDESEGTGRFFELIEPLAHTLAVGGLLAIDELDQSLHPLLVRKIISLFHDPTINKKGAQLVFNTHDATLLDPKLFRRDQIWFMEKDNASKTRLYSLLDYSPRKDEALQRGYLLGRYGGIPFLGGFHFPSKRSA
ncbi:MAG TPA: AAA family ATPase [Polyangium sp.]|nr:AAA family ATPase [Polyangium sp.]